METVIVNTDEEMKTSDSPMDVSQTSDFLHKSKAAIYTLVCRRQIPYWKRAGQLYFFRDELIKWIRSSEDRINKAESAINSDTN